MKKTALGEISGLVFRVAAFLSDRSPDSVRYYYLQTAGSVCLHEVVACGQEFGFTPCSKLTWPRLVPHRDIWTYGTGKLNLVGSTETARPSFCVARVITLRPVEKDQGAL
jgi:hypothetical protein